MKTNLPGISVLEEQHKKVQDQINALPEDKRKVARAAQKAVDDELDKFNSLLFADVRFELDAFLKKEGIPGAMRDQFINGVKSTALGSLFVVDQKTYIRTYDDLILPAHKYIKSLESAVIEQVQFKEVKYVTRTTSLDKLGFVDLIKLAFSRLRKGESRG